MGKFLKAVVACSALILGLGTAEVSAEQIQVEQRWRAESVDADRRVMFVVRAGSTGGLVTTHLHCGMPNGAVLREGRRRINPDGFVRVAHRTPRRASGCVVRLTVSAEDASEFRLTIRQKKRKAQ